MEKKAIAPELCALIDEAVKRAVAATCAAHGAPAEGELTGTSPARRATGAIADRRSVAQIEERKNCYKQTERRLYALPHLTQKVAQDAERLNDMRQGIVQQKSKSIVRFSASGVRADPEEMAEALMQDVAARIAVDQQEIDEVREALKSIGADSYYYTVPARYFDGQRDFEVAEALHCDESTVRRNRARLVRIVSIHLYGSIAIG